MKKEWIIFQSYDNGNNKKWSILSGLFNLVFFLIKIIQLFFIDTGFDFFFNEIVVVLEMDE